MPAKKLKRENRGGVREGAGRPRQEISTAIIEELIECELKHRGMKKKSVQDILLGLVHHKDPRIRLAASKVFLDKVVVRESHHTKDVRTYKPALLPVLGDDPSKIDRPREKKELH
jgi:hypothetical protein